MAKTIISVRVSPERLAKLDAAGLQLGMTRSEAINAAIRLLPEIISGRSELRYEPSQLQIHLQTPDDEQTE